MLDNIIRFSLRNRLVVVVVALLLSVVGVHRMRHSEVDVFPDLNAPTVTIMTEARGMAAEEVEQMITAPIESSVNGAQGVRRVRSSSSTGFSVVWVEFDWDVDIYRARQTVSEKVAAIAGSLPSCADQPVMGPQSSILGELLIVGLTSDSTSLTDLRTYADKFIRRRLLSIGGVAQVSVLGGEVKEYQILIHPERMSHFDVSLSDVLSATENLNANTGGGLLTQYGNEYVVRGIMAADDLFELGRSVVKSVDGGTVVLEDVADLVVGTLRPLQGCASEKGRPAVLLTVTKQPGTGTVDLTDRIERALDEMRPTLPRDVRISTDAYRQSRFIESSISNVTTALMEGVFMVVLVLVLFLANARTTLISVVTLPLSLFITVIVMHSMGLTLNTMSLGGMAIAIGSLVDDAIVDVENVWKHLRANAALPPSERLSVSRVVFDASREVRLPILNSTLIIIAGFLPLFFLDGMEGRMLVPLGLAFVISLFASTLVALTLTPVLCSYLLASESRGGKHGGESAVAVFFKRHYRRALCHALSHKRLYVAASGLFFVAAVLCFFTLGRNFLPSFNEGSLTINISAMPGISLEESDALGRQAEELLLGVPEIQTVVRKTGRAELDEHALGVNVSEIEAPFTTGVRSHSDIIRDVRDRLSALSGANIEIGQPISHRLDAMLSGTRASIAIKVYGNDLTQLFRLGNHIKSAVADVDGVVDLNVEQQIERPELRIRPNREMLARYGITMPMFARIVSVAMGGRVVGQVYEQGGWTDIVVRSAEEDCDTPDHLLDMMIDDGRGHKLPLSNVARVYTAMGPNSINRENGQRLIVVSANSSGRDVAGVVRDIRSRISSEVVLPEGYRLEFGGQFESESSARNVILAASVLGIAVIFLLLYLQFGSVRQSGIILINLPLALVGGVFSLMFTTGQTDIPALIGFISLFGIATRGGMLLVSHYNTLLSGGGSLRETVVQGSLDRLNPILMTALSSALALVPLALRGDLPGNEIQSPMAKVILGGLITSTLLNAFVIPVVYEWLHGKQTPETRIR